jgi:CheY-like chemotaxis protein
MDQENQVTIDRLPEAQQEVASESLPEAWINELEGAFAPFPPFVQKMSDGLLNLALVQTEWFERFEQQIESVTHELAQTKAELARVQQEAALIATASPKKTTRTRSENSSNSASLTEKRDEKRGEKRILLVDDAEVTRVLMAHYLKGLPVKLDFAPNLGRALGYCDEKSFDLLLVDLELNGRDLEGLLQSLKGKSGQAKVLALSPNVFSSEEEASALRCGFDLYLSRSLPKQDVIEKLENSLWG